VITEQGLNEAKLESMRACTGFKLDWKLIMIDNQFTNEIKIIYKEGKSLKTKTYKTNPFE
jgi:hypothetical protein